MAEDLSATELIDTYPLENLITAPLQALIDSQKITTSTMLQYILSMTEIESREEMENVIKNNLPIRLKSANFILKRMTQNDQGKFETNDYRLEVPLITLFPVPYLSIKEAELNFDFKVIDVTKDVEGEEKTGMEQKSIIPGRHIIQTRYSSLKETSKEASSDISIKIKVSQSDVPMGLAKFLTAASSSIVEKDSQ